MHQRVYKAPTMAQALALAKKELGPDALILRTRTIRAGGVMGIGTRELVEIVAAPHHGDQPPTAQVISTTAQPPTRALRDRLQRTYSVPNPTDQAANFRPSRRNVDGMAPHVSEEHVDRGAADAGASGLESELASLKRLVGKVLQTTREASLRGVHSGHDALRTISGSRDELVAMYLRLLEADVATEIADEVIAAVRDALTPAELADSSRVRQEVLRHLASLVPVADVGSTVAGLVPDPAASRQGVGRIALRPYIITLIGPTGVGKTTTLAKLAAAYTLRHNRAVGIIAADTLRLGAVDQLRLYATIIGVPIRVCATPRDARAALESLAACDIILMDTAGCPPRDAEAMNELRAMLRAIDADETHLVLSATSSWTTIMEAAKQFAPAEPDHLLLTKLDEAVNFGVLLSAARAIDLRLSYLTTGQEVPDHLELVRGERLASLILGEGSDATASAGR